VHGGDRRGPGVQTVSAAFAERVAALPHLGIGVSTEYGAAQAGPSLDPNALHARHPEFAGFLEIGVELSKGIDADAVDWIEAGRPITWHFLDLNLHEPEDFTPDWIEGVLDGVAQIAPAWMCGDSGLWHFGPRDRAQMCLLPPVLTAGSADAMADGVAHLRERVGLEVLPENPPGAAYVGDLHLLDYYARVAERADCGLLLDCAHLAIYQRVMGHEPLDGLDSYPLDRVVEMHVAGGTVRDHEGLAWIDDDHTPSVLPETWAIFEWVAARAPNLRAVVFECERNPIEDCLAGFERIRSLWPGHREGA
jgi:uncharacterized protein (UPF0276 family)